MLVLTDMQCWIAARAPSTSTDSDKDCQIIDDKADIQKAMEYIATVFQEPLETNGACLFALIDEIDEIVDFYQNYLQSQAIEY